MKNILLIIALITLCSCGDNVVYEYPKDQSGKDLDRMGSLVSDSNEGGISIFSTKSRRENNIQSSTINGYIWRAAMESVSFMSLNSTDSKGGVIITDWYSDSKNNSGNEYKLNILILDADLSPNSLQVNVFKRKKVGNSWINIKSTDGLKEEFENRILTRARELKILQSQ